MFPNGYHDPELMAALSRTDGAKASAPRLQAAVAIGCLSLWLAVVWFVLPVLGL